mmetsp:Transcript_50051/g.83873  ORF Transcript_50051/g.83873 Transcript_50051/m.83873 type:complete len:93 (+) Transcript_50051:127-405(+)
MPILLQLRSGEIIEVKGNQRSYGFLLFWSATTSAQIELKADNADAPKLSFSSGRLPQAALWSIEKQLTGIKTELITLGQKVDRCCGLYEVLN